MVEEQFLRVLKLMPTRNSAIPVAEKVASKIEREPDRKSFLANIPLDKILLVQLDSRIKVGTFRKTFRSSAYENGRLYVGIG